MTSDGRVVDFFGTRVRVVCDPADAEDVDFFFGPHVVPAGRGEGGVRYVVELRGTGGFLRSLLAKDERAKTFRILDAGGALLEERTFTRWSAVPSPLPPFRLLRAEVAVVQATVLVHDDRCVAFCGPPHSGKTSLGLLLAARGWALVSDQLLVVRRATGEVCPYLAPLGVRGRTLEGMREGVLAGLPRRDAYCSVSGEVVLTRPEGLAPVVRVADRPRAPRLVTVRREPGPPGIRPAELVPRVWPPDARPDLGRALAGTKPTSLLRLPALGGEQRAADLVEEYFLG